MAYHATDYWFYVLADVAAMAAHVERGGRSFAQLYMEHPAFEYTYYGMYLDLVAPAARRHERIMLPEAINALVPLRRPISLDLSTELVASCDDGHG